MPIDQQQNPAVDRDAIRARVQSKLIDRYESAQRAKIDTMRKYNMTPSEYASFAGRAGSRERQALQTGDASGLQSRDTPWHSGAGRTAASFARTALPSLAATHLLFGNSGKWARRGMYGLGLGISGAGAIYGHMKRLGNAWSNNARYNSALEKIRNYEPDWEQ